MQCLKDYIGFRGCTTVTPGSGLYINSLPGINLETTDKTADSEQLTFAGVWEDVQTRSLRRLETDITSKLGKIYRIKNPKHSYNIGRGVTVAETTVPAANEMLGIKISKAFYSSLFVDSVLSDIYIQSVAFYATTAGIEVTLKFINERFELVYEKVFTSAEGWNQFEIEQRFADKTIFVVASDVELMPQVKLDVNPYGYYGYGGCNDCEGGEWYAIRGVKITGGNQITEGGDSFGISVIASIQCSYNAIVCANKSLFATALWYLEGSELMTERLFSTRLNRFTKIDKDSAKEAIDYFTSHYEKEIDKAIESIRVIEGDACIECNAQFQSTTVIP